MVIVVIVTVGGEKQFSLRFFWAWFFKFVSPLADKLNEINLSNFIYTNKATTEQQQQQQQ